jgi:hypothetical protein
MDTGNDLKQQTNPQPPEEPQEEIYDGPEPVELVYKVVAAFLLIWPFSWLITALQDLLEPLVSLQISNIIVLVGILGFLFIIGRTARLLKRLHKNFLNSDQS